MEPIDVIFVYVHYHKLDSALRGHMPLWSHHGAYIWQRQTYFELVQRPADLNSDGLAILSEKMSVFQTKYFMAKLTQVGEFMVARKCNTKAIWKFIWRTATSISTIGRTLLRIALSDAVSTLLIYQVWSKQETPKSHRDVSAHRDVL